VAKWIAFPSSDLLYTSRLVIFLDIQFVVNEFYTLIAFLANLFRDVTFFYLVQIMRRSPRERVASQALSV
jgi:hypothetical protein